ncbi:MAG: teicoplanin resistance protein VanZ, partial [Chitinophagaceae bacterium]|nr:teicoplanin resistance protein VanZ [Chitinophagaceae bacterium]
PFILLLFFLYIIAFSSRSLTAIGYIILASFCVYVFFVLKLTGYFDLSFRLASPDWLHNIKQRIHSHERINLTPFKVFHIYSASNVQIIGNFIMLIPLGIYIGLFINNPSFIKAFTIILLTTVSIELMQLLTNYRSTDIDDVILNTTGGIMGWIIYQTVLKQLPIKKGR